MFAFSFLTKNVTSMVKVDASATVERPLLVTIPNWPKNAGEEPMYRVIPDVMLRPEIKKDVGFGHL